MLEVAHGNGCSFGQPYEAVTTEVTVVMFIWKIMPGHLILPSPAVNACRALSTVRVTRSRTSSRKSANRFNCISKRNVSPQVEGSVA